MPEMAAGAQVSWLFQAFFRHYAIKLSRKSGQVYKIFAIFFKILFIGLILCIMEVKKRTRQKEAYYGC